MEWGYNNSWKSNISQGQEVFWLYYYTRMITECVLIQIISKEQDKSFSIGEFYYNGFSIPNMTKNIGDSGDFGTEVMWKFLWLAIGIVINN